MTVRVLIVDDHEPVRRGIRSLLTRRADWSVCGEAADGLEATELARELRPDVILMDMSMPRMNGADAAAIIRREVPESKIIIVTQNDPELMRRQVSEIGARGFVSKATLSRDLLPAILRIIGDGYRPEPHADDRSSGDGSLFRGGDLGYLIRQFDWSQTPLGAIDDWPQSLKTAVNLMLNSQHPIWIGWGPEMTFLYNDAYISVLSLAKHPGSLGRPAREVWAEIWDVCGPLADRVFSKGEAAFVNDVRLYMSRGEYLEETCYSFSYSPIYDERGNVGGLFCPSTETTARVLHARRLRTLSELSAKALIEKSTAAACSSSVATLSQNSDDIPFALLYLLDEERNLATLCGVSHIAPGIARVSPREIQLDEGESPFDVWPVREVLRTSHPLHLPLTGIDGLPLGAAQQPVTEAMILPVTSPGRNWPVGVLIAGVSPTRKLDAEYSTFFSLVADQVGTAIQNARAAEQEKKRAEALAEIDRAKTLFFSNVSHEFRTPLTLMLGPLEEILAREKSLSAEEHEQLSLIHRNGLRLLKLVNTLLDFSRIEAGKVQSNFQPTDVAQLTADLASLFRSATQQAGLRLLVDCPPLPEPVSLDRDMWEKIVLNLLSNAFKFTFHGEIAVTLRAVQDAVELSVRDTGTGIPAHEIPHLFERFHRVQNAQSRTNEGTGIGLALVQELVKLHGGSIRVQSAFGKGSTFVVSVPRVRTHLPAAATPGISSVPSARSANPYVEEALRWLPPQNSRDSAPDAAAVARPRGQSHSAAKIGTPSSLSGARILFADDNADMRQYVQHLFGGECQVTLAEDGQAALQQARETLPDLILSDVMMPRLDGFDLLNEVRRDPLLKNTPVILISARAGEEAWIEGLESGADDYVVKPFSARELQARVASHIAMARLRRQAEEWERALRADAESDHARLRELLMRAPAAICMLHGPEHRFTYVNLEFLKTTRRERVEDFIGKTISEGLPVVEGQGIVELLDDVYQTGEPYVAIERKLFLPGSDGAPEERYFSFTYQPLRGPQGHVEGIFVHGVDVTAQVMARRSIEESEERLRMAQSAARAGAWEWDPKQNVQHLSPELHRIFGTEASDDGHVAKWYARVHPEDMLRVRELMDKGFISGEMDLEYRYFHPQLGLRWLYCKGRRIRDEARMFGVVLDVTDRKNSEQTIRDIERTIRDRETSWELLRAQDEERRHIARELHDSAGQTLALLAMNLGLLAETAKAASAEVARSADDALELVEQLTREIRTTSYLLHPPLLEESGLPAALTWYIRGLTERSGIDITLNIADDFGRLPRDMELAIFRLVQECLTNIHRHSGSKIASIEAVRERDRVVIEVGDQGKGIPAEKLAEIQVRGAGVGIRGMRERLRQFDGELTIESDGSGTRVIADIPVPKETSVLTADDEPQAFEPAR